MAINNSQHTVLKFIAIGVSIIISLFLSTIIFLVLQSNNNNLPVNAVLYIFSSILLFVLPYTFFTKKYRFRKKVLSMPFPDKWENILIEYVDYYNALEEKEKQRFREKIKVFISEIRMTGIKTEVDDITRVLVAASSVIPVFQFPDWEYNDIIEILIYPTNFSDDYDISKNGNILGMVPSQSSALIFSKSALIDGFRKGNDRSNVGIHEFIHKVDGQDGIIDGIPALFMNRNLQDKWMHIMNTEMQLIEEKNSDINPYALTNTTEFFAVVSEYFFENPRKMEKEHAELYNILRSIFHQDTLKLFKNAFKHMIKPKKHKTGRNEPCPCGSGEKFKKCCILKYG